MNLPYTYQLLAAADAQRHGFIKLRGVQADQEVRLMAQAGLVEASFDDGKEGSFTSINRLTQAGHTFLRVFKNRAIPDAATVTGPFTFAQTIVAAWSGTLAGSLLQSNDNWRTTQEAEIIATGLPPSNDLDSAIVATLPGNGAAFTAIVRGVNSSTGVALVEVYALN